MFVSHKHRFVFFHIEKTAGSHIERELCRVLDEDHWRCVWGSEEWGNLNKQKPADGQHTKHLGPKQLAGRWEKGQLDDYFKWAVVRNPWSLCLSYYSMMTQWPKYASVQGFHCGKHGRIHPLNDYKDFTEFVELGGVGQGPAPARNYLTSKLSNPCTRFLCGSVDPDLPVLVDHVAHYEDLQEEMDKITKQIGIPSLDMQTRKQQLCDNGEPFDCSSTHRTPEEAYTAKTAAIVGRLNTIDCKRFDYMDHKPVCD